MKEDLPETHDALPIVRGESRPPAPPKKQILPANTTKNDDTIDEQLENVSGGVRFARTPDRDR